MKLDGIVDVRAPLQFSGKYVTTMLMGGVLFGVGEVLGSHLV